MKLQVYKPEKEVNRVPQLLLKGRCLIAVDDAGNVEAYLFDFSTMRPPSASRGLLASAGYNTSFAEWDRFGGMTKLLVDIEP